MHQAGPLLFVERLHATSQQLAPRPALTYLPHRDGSEATWTFGEADRRARAVAVAALEHAQAGDRALILCPTGLDFVAALLGCFYAGIVAVPAYPPANARHLPRIARILKDSEASLVLTTADARERIGKWLSAEEDRWPTRVLQVDGVDDDAADGWRAPALTAASLAFVQYTSGSTREPKGVMVSHGNLIANLRMIQDSFQHTPKSDMGSWLPMFHDMGLVGNLLEPLYLGARTVFMAPQAFIQNPVRWLQMITRYRSVWTGAPNFGYAHCVRRVTEAQRRDLDLSSLQHAYCGSEPIDRQVMERFAECFEACGFRREALYPCYGMAEATLLSTGNRPRAGPRYLAVDTDALAEHRVLPATAPGSDTRLVVGCGHSTPGQTLRIVDPQTRRALADGHIGEVWVAGAHVAMGYWRDPALSRDHFQATLAGADGPRFLRTGDLAFVHEGELFFVGRMLDVIIIRGRNHHPQDIERTVAESSAALQPEAGAAFSVAVEGSAQLVVVHEVRRTALQAFDREQAARDVRAGVLDEHGLSVHDVVILKPGTLPRTSSGKVRRSACKAAYLDDTLDAVSERSSPVAPGANGADNSNGANGKTDALTQRQPGACDPAPGARDDSRRRADALIQWLRAYADRRIDTQQISERRTIPPYIVLDFGNVGLLGLQAPVAAGGLDLTFGDTFCVLEQLAAVDLTLASFVGVQNALGVRPLLRFGSAAQKRDLLPAIAGGRELASFAFTEPAAGSNPTAIEATARPDGAGGWRLNGAKRWIGSASWAGYVHVFAHLLDAGERRRGITGFVVRQDAAGFGQGPEELTLGLRGMVQNSIVLDDVAVRPCDVLGAAGQGMAIAQDIMEFGRVSVAAVALGAMKRSAQLMTRYAARRQVVTGTLVDNVLARSILTQLTTEIAALEALLDRFGQWLDAGLRVPTEFYASLKQAAAEAAFRGVDQLMQMLGGRGYIETNIAPHLFRDVRLLRIFEGPSETMQMFVGNRLAVGSPPLAAFLRNTVNAHAIASELEDTARSLSRAFTEAAAGEHDAQPGQHVAMLLGELGVWALWLAVVDAAAREPGGDRLARARAWLREEYRSGLAKAGAAPGGERPLTRAEIEHVIAAYANSIGDIEQHRPGTVNDTDPLLVRDRAPATGTRPAATATDTDGKRAASLRQPDAASADGSRAIEQWLQGWIARRLQHAPEAIAATRPFADYGLDSVTAVELVHDLGDWLGVDVAATSTWDFPTIESLAAHLAHGGARDSRKGDATGKANGNDNGRSNGSDDGKGNGRDDSPGNGGAATATGVQEPAAPEVSVDDLSEEAVAALLARELDDMAAPGRPR